MAASAGASRWALHRPGRLSQSLAGTQEKNAEVLAALKGAGARAMALAVDVTDRTALEPAFRRVEAELGPVDILVNNAGIANLSGGILQETAESWDNVIETQLNAVFLLSKLAAASMAGTQARQDHQPRQHVLLLRRRTDSLLQRRERRDRAADQVDGHRAGAAWHPGQRHCSRLDRDGHDGGRSGPRHFKAMNDEILARTPAGRWGQPEEMAGTAIFLASSASDFVTGETIRVDGGYAIR